MKSASTPTVLRTVLSLVGILVCALLIAISIACTVYLGIVQQTYQARKCPGHESLAIFFCLTATLLGAPIAMLMLLARLPICQRTANAEYEPVVDNSKRNGFEIISDWIGKITRFLCIASAFAGTITLLVLTFIVLAFQTRHLTVQYDGTVQGITQLQSGATIAREANGNVHITAQEDADLYFAQGFATAQDRLFQLDFQRKLAAGTLSAVYGKAALKLDQFARTIGFYRAATESFASYSTEARSMLQSYCDGINKYIEKRPSNPPEFYPFPQTIVNMNPVDLIAWAKVFSWYHSANVAEEIVRYQLLQNETSMQRVVQNLTSVAVDTSILAAKDLNVNITNAAFQTALRDLTDESGAATSFTAFQSIASQTYTSDSPFVFLYNTLVTRVQNRQNYWASNGIAVAGAHTANKSAILATAFQPMGMLVPALMHNVHLKGKSVNAIGSALVGLPGILTGRNDFISWGVVDSVVDSQDLFALRVSSSDPESYIFNNNPVKFATRQETIAVRNEKDTVLTVKESVYGPIVSDIFELGNAPLALKWTALLPRDTSAEALVTMHTKASWAQFSASLQANMTDTYLHFLFADKQGNIGFVAPGQIHGIFVNIVYILLARVRGHSGRFAVVGTGAYSSSYVTSTIAVQNPEKGYIIAANQRTTPMGHPISMQLDSSPTYRALRIQNILDQQSRNVTASLLMSVLADVQSTVFENFRFVVKQMNGSSFLGIDGESARNKLEQWDGNATPTSREAALFETWLQYMQRHTFELLSTRYFSNPSLILKFLQVNNNGFCQDVYNMTCTDFAAQELGMAATDLVLADENTEVTEWSKLHTANFKHAAMDKNQYECYTRRIVGKQGGTETVNFAFTTPNDATVSSTATYKNVIDMSTQEVLISSAFGQSDNGLAFWYDNAQQAWLDEQYTSFKMNEDKPAQHTFQLVK